ncbi:MAG: hypothetical protein JNJ61_02485, partial [Anaerolineae bacterium]|nr:hypothetical protein [Anaerolineae bacterium]
NVVGFVLSGILHMKARQPNPNEARTHLSSLFKGVAIMRNNAFYRMMFAGPATVLVGYNLLLQLSGARIEDFLPDGAWQFYLEFGLREDAARHSSETIGFQIAAKALRPAPQEVEELTAWLLSIMWLLRDYDYLITNVWEENVRLSAIEEFTGLIGLHRAWEARRPFALPPGQDALPLSAYRRQQFDEFCQTCLRQIGSAQRRQFELHWNDTRQQAIRSQSLEQYRQQMSIRSALEPGDHSDQRIRISSSAQQVAVVFNDVYHLVPFIDPINPTAPAIIYKQAQQILATPASPEASQVDRLLARVPRASQSDLRKHLGSEQQPAFAEFHRTPVIINWDMRDGTMPLSLIRQGRRGIGDHAMTIFRTSRSMVFDFSHIYFDGPWAMEIAEMLTNEAVRRIRQRDATRTTAGRAPDIRTLTLQSSARFERAVRKLPLSVNHVSGEASTSLSNTVDLRRILSERTRPNVRLTVNDLLVLHRTCFNQQYRPSSAVDQALQQLRRASETRQLARDVDDMFVSIRESNPSLLIPIDATRRNPRDRLFPSTFRSPLPDFYRLHCDVYQQQTQAARERFRKSAVSDSFQKLRAEYLGMLVVFADIMKRYREIALQGQSMSTTAIRLIAGLPGAMQRVVDGLPGRFSFINEAIKGEEVFSNVGRVTAGSSLTRFASAKDDNDKKVLVWGIMTDDTGALHITLRDFRPAVLALSEAGHDSVAQLLTQDFVSAYIASYTEFIEQILAIVRAPRL